ncbi:uncharacterized protein LOC121386751 [Gigantopelta aegis]|uniref:uncharacterized protein LOC121386751 n=1 Tax=Gigantopelta aegis TaxID=1735272 RepID=UPI001B887A5B|nr:uncharacterized protein LOC121386751 [Gigantopelta aegis]
MASASSTDHDEISCSLCLEVFTDPRGLPCGHTYCLKCLQTHINVNTFNDNSFLCPNCRRETKIPDSTQPRISWAAQFSRLTDLVKAIDVIKKFKIRDDMKVSNEEDPHRLVIKSSCDVIKNLGPVIENQMMSDIKRLQRSVDVSATQTAAQIQRQGDELIAEFTTAVRTALEKRNLELEKCRQSVNNEIMELFTDANRMIEEGKKYLELGERLLTSGSPSDIKNNVLTFTNMRTLTADYAAKYHSEIPHLAITLTEPAKTKGKTFVADIGRILKPDIKSFHLIRKAQLDVPTFHKEMNIDQTSDLPKEENISNLPVIPCALKINQTINAKEKSGARCPHLTSILVLGNQTSNKIIVTDYSNKCVKLFCSQNTKAIPIAYKLKTEPYDTAESRDHLVLVTLPRQREILYLKIDDGIQKLRTVRTEKECYYISVLPNGNMAVSEGLGKGVSILDQSGGTLHTLAKEIVPDPGCITVKGETIVLVLQTDQTVTCMTTSGNVAWVSRDPTRLMNLQGVTCDDEGCVYVCDYERNAIVQLSREGDILRDVITPRDGLKQPGAVCCYRDKLYVAEKKGQIKIFTWSPV